VDLWLAPGMNIHRNPLCGRNFEYYSEDPYLTGKMAAAITKGVQSCGVGVTVKHMAVNNQEDMRANCDSRIDERTLREIYLKGFEMVIREAAPWAVMTSYNDINGIPAADSYDLCTRFARDECGHEGLIMTDWGGGLSYPLLNIYAGNDMIQPGGRDAKRNIEIWCDSGKTVRSKGEQHFQAEVTRAMLEDCLVRILNVVKRCKHKQN
ncbi:MAG: beta-glucosidase, partial [Ruminococcus flavefaciens]|nr:beta-glucosidase [Ruminococcus flavefaciens]